MSNKLWESVKEKCLIDYCGTPFCAMTKEEFEGKLQTLASIIRDDTGCEWCTIEMPKEQYDFWITAYGGEDNLREILNKYKVELL